MIKRSLEEIVLSAIDTRIKESDVSLDILIDIVDDLMLEERFEVIDKLINVCSDNDFSDCMIYTIYSITYIAKDKLKNFNIIDTRIKEIEKSHEN